jgi:hypothetical protein
MPVGDGALGDEAAAILDRHLGDELLVAVEHARHVREEEQALRRHGAGDGAGEGIGVDVVGFPVRPDRDGGEDRDQLGLQDRVEDRAVDPLRLADEAEIDVLLDVRIGIDHGARGFARHDHVAVLPAQPHGLAALGPDPADDLLVDGTGQDHLDDLDGGLVGDAQPRLELGPDAELLQHPPDLRPAPVDDDGLEARLL